MLRSMRYGEADRILHLYTPQRGTGERDRQGRAQGQVALRRPPGAVLPPRRHLPRGPVGPADGHQRDHAWPRYARLREHGPSLDAAARACDAVCRLFATDDPHPGVFHLLANELALLDAAAGARDGRQRPRLPAQAAARRRHRAAAERLRELRRGRPRRRLQRRRRRRRLPGVRGRARSGSTRPRTRSSSTRSGSPLAETPRRRAARPRAGRPRRARDRRAPRGCATRSASAADAVGRTTSRTAARDMRDLLGGKGANVAEMTRVLGRRARARPASPSPRRRASPT